MVLCIIPCTMGSTLWAGLEAASARPPCGLSKWGNGPQPAQGARLHASWPQIAPTSSLLFVCFFNLPFCCVGTALVQYGLVRPCVDSPQSSSTTTAGHCRSHPYYGQLGLCAARGQGGPFTVALSLLLLGAVWSHSFSFHWLFCLRSLYSSARKWGRQFWVHYTL